SDYSTFAYLADVYILTEYRKKGLSKWLMQFILSHPELQGLRRFSLATLDAHGLYEQFGFKKLETPDRYMEIKNADIYTKKK
ncbi:MAG TPA: GNAT family N-acetyltransferase, partial [Bacteroidia bacterium]